MTTRRASCSCGQLAIVCEGEPVRVSICHCLACQRRTGSVFGTQARFHRDQVDAIEGSAAQYSRIADSGYDVTFNFCPRCGATVYWRLGGAPDFVVVAVGNFADPGFPAPLHSVYEARRPGWLPLLAGAQVEHQD